MYVYVFIICVCARVCACVCACVRVCMLHAYTLTRMHTHMQVSVTEAAAGDVIIVASDGLWNAFGGRRPPGDVSQEEKGLSGELLVRSCTIYMYTYMYIHTYVQGVSQG